MPKDLRRAAQELRRALPELEEYALLLENAAIRIDLLAHAANTAATALVEMPARFTIEIQAAGPKTVQEALALLAEKCGFTLEEFLEKKLVDLEKLK